MQKLFIVTPLIAAISLFADASTELVSVNWQNLTALAAIIIVLLFLVIKYLPDINKTQAEQSKTFAASSQAQTDAATKATSQASIESTKAMAQAAAESAKAMAMASSESSRHIVEMHKEFVSTLDKMADRFQQSLSELNVTMHAMHGTCPAGKEWQRKVDIKP